MLEETRQLGRISRKKRLIISILRKIDQRCRQSNRLTPTIVAMLQALDPQGQCPNITSTSSGALKELVSLPASTLIRKVTMRLSVPSQWRTKTPQKTRDSLGNPRINDWDQGGCLTTILLHLIPGSIRKRGLLVLISIMVLIARTIMMARTVTIAMISLNNPRQAEKRLILPENFLLADASMVFQLQQCRHMVCRDGACLDDLHGCGRLSGWNSLWSKRTCSCDPKNL